MEVEGGFFGLRFWGFFSFKQWVLFNVLNACVIFCVDSGVRILYACNIWNCNDIFDAFSLKFMLLTVQKNQLALTSY